ncbi:MAG: hypothetical protein AAF616_05090 [Bacteroidota bacterium]
MINKSFALVLCCLNFHCLFAQTDLVPEDLTKKFFETYAQDPALAISDAFKTTKWVDENGDGVLSMISQLEGTIALVGDYLGYELLKEKKVGSRFVMYAYLVYYERQPLRFTLTFYKSGEKWMYFNVKYDDSMDEEVEEAMKVYRSR